MRQHRAPWRLQFRSMLVESIQALARKPPGPDREGAIANAHEALLETQGATVALPAELRATSTSPTAGRDESVQRLVKAADSHDDENFRDRTAQLAASQSCPDLRDSKLGWFDEVKSTRVTCG